MTMTEPIHGIPVDAAELLDIRTACDELHDDLRGFAQSFGPLADRVQGLQTRVHAARAETQQRIHEMPHMAGMHPGDARELEQGLTTVIDILTGYRRMLEALFATGVVVDPEAVLDGKNEREGEG